MVKNEENTIKLSLDSVKDVVTGVKIFDTGSTDCTLDVIDKWSKENKNISIDIKEGKFVDFSTSRNVLLDFVDEDDNVDYIIMLDSNDQLTHGEKLAKALAEFTEESGGMSNVREKTSGAFYVQQKWFANGTTDSYFNIRCVASRMGWRFFGKVHEYLSRSGSDSPYTGAIHLPSKETAWVFQDRRVGADSSAGRYKRDAILLEKQRDEEIANGSENGNSRTLFYLAQTYSCLERKKDAYAMYKLRALDPDFKEEQFHAHLRAGDISMSVGETFYTRVCWYLKAFTLLERAEPLCKLSKMYSDTGPNQCMHTAYMFSKRALDLEIPKDSVLFIERDAYLYQRYHLHGIVCWYVGEMDEGLAACEMAIAERNAEIDITNIEFYKNT